MQWLAEISIKRPVFASVLVLSLVVVGAFSYFNLGVDRFPKVDFPTVSMTTRQPGAAPEEVETEITDRIERAVNTISGIDELRSISTEGVSQVFIQFKLEKNVDVAAQEVRDKVNQILADLPPGHRPRRSSTRSTRTRRPSSIWRCRPKRPIREITEFADKTVRRELEASARRRPGARSSAAAPRQVNIWLDPARLRAYNLTVAEVARARRQPEPPAARRHREPGPRELTVRMKGRVEHRTRVRRRWSWPTRNGTQITLARRRRGRGRHRGRRDRGATSTASRPCVLAIRKQSGTNTVAVVDARQGAARRDRAAAAGRLRARRSSATSRSTSRRRSTTVQEHLVVGAFLAALVVLLFLRQLALHGDRRHRDPDLDHRHLRASCGRWASRSTS